MLEFSGASGGNRESRMKPITVNGFLIRQEPGGLTLSLEEVAVRCGLHPRVVERFVTLGLIDPEEGQSVGIEIQRARP